MEPKVETEVIGTSDKTGFVEYQYCPICESDDIIKEYHCTCQECFYDWYTTEDYDIQTGCPNCSQGDIHYEYE